MKRTIHTGKHRPWPPMLPMRWYDKKVISRRIMLTESCLYDLPGTNDDTGVNILFGIAYFPNYNINSACFAWHYDAPTTHLSIDNVCYLNGERIAQTIGAATIYKPCDFTLTIKNGQYIFLVKEVESGNVMAEDVVSMGHNKKWGFPLGLHFGGSQAAPHKMTFHISKK